MLSGCFSGTLCLWTGDGLRQAKINAHPSSLILDVNFSGHSSHLLSLGSDHRLCIWSYSSFDLLVELSSISSNSLLIFRTNYLFYCQGRDLYVYETLKSSKISTKQFPLNFLDESETKIDKLCYSSSSECVIVQHADVIYALHLPQDFFLF